MAGRIEADRLNEADAAIEIPGNDPGIWSHVVPYVLFLLVVQLRGSSWQVPAPWGGFAEALVPLAAIVFFAYRGDYPELGRKHFLARWIPVDLLVGALSGLAWMAPFLFWSQLRPDELTGSLSAESEIGAWITRGLTFVIAVPLLEELFIRSFVMRQADAIDTDRSFRTFPIASFTLRSFLVTTVFFTLAHQTWEWWVAAPWVMLTSAWFYYRKSMWSVIVAHAAANLTILVFVALQHGQWRDADGNVISLWFFV